MIKLSNAVKNEVVEKIEYNEIVRKVSAIQITDTGDLVKETDSSTKIIDIEKKVTDHDHSNKYITTQ